MKHLKRYKELFESEHTLTPEQIEWLDECTKGPRGGSSYGTWSLSPKTGLVNVRGNFNCSEQELKNFKGVRFGRITKDFDCRWNSLTTLEGGPQEVGGNFFCSINSLTSLKGAPQKVGGSFDCENNSLTSLKGAPQEVGENFRCEKNSLTTLEGAPKKVGGNFWCYNNPVSETTLKKIWNEMKSGLTYSESIRRLSTDIPKEDWDLLDKSGLEVSDEFLKGASVLRRFL